MLFLSSISIYKSSQGSKKVRLQHFFTPEKSTVMSLACTPRSLYAGLVDGAVAVYAKAEGRGRRRQQLSPLSQSTCNFLTHKRTMETRTDTQERVLKVSVLSAPPNPTKERAQCAPSSLSSLNLFPAPTLTVLSDGKNCRPLSVCGCHALCQPKGQRAWTLAVVPLCPSPFLASLASPFLLSQSHRKFSWIPVMGAGLAAL